MPSNSRFLSDAFKHYDWRNRSPCRPNKAMDGDTYSAVLRAPIE
jgi:hypothetical protein